MEDGGEATLCTAEFIEGISPAELHGLFAAERDADYREIASAAEGLSTGMSRPSEEDTGPAEQELTRLRRRLDEVVAIDYFGAGGRKQAERAIAGAESRISHSAPAKGGLEGLRGHTWVTRSDVFVDRIASAWLIRRFIDSEATFKFTGSRSYRPRPGEVRFDMFEAEYGHEGDRCTFETLLQRSGLRDRALRAIGEIVHDIDCKDEKFGREEAPGVAALLRGLVLAQSDDATRLEHGGALLDQLYASLRSSR
jgi:hypothetical protein